MNKALIKKLPGMKKRSRADAVISPTAFIAMLDVPAERTAFFSKLVSGSCADSPDPAMVSGAAYSMAPASSRVVGLTDDLNYLRQTGLFSATYYLETYPDAAASGMDPLEHFFCSNLGDGRRPNPYFCTDWYLQTNADVRNAGMQPLLHYAKYGEREGRRPGPFFDPVWYRHHHNIPHRQFALSHYLEHVLSYTVSPIPEFDVAYYAQAYPDVRTAGIDPFDHFINYGFQEGRNPSHDFDTRFYADRYCKGNLNINPFLHYLEHRHEPGIFGSLPAEEVTVARELKRYAAPGPEFEDFTPLTETTVSHVKALAFYLPQFHAFKENDEWWGKGFTEWANISRGTPRFVGHYQPRIPRDLGFYTLDRIEPMLRQIEMAKGAGIHGFIFYHYWFNGKRLMEAPVERFLQAPEADMPFCLMWANESWTRRWDGSEGEVLMAQDHGADDHGVLTADFARHFRDPRYIRIQGRPLLMIYRPALIPDTAATIARWREVFNTTHGENPIIIMAQSFDDNDPTRHGLDGAVEFPPHKLTGHLGPENLRYKLLDAEFSGKIIAYDEVVRASLEEVRPPYKLIKTAVPSWDNDARRQGQGLVITSSTPAKYESWLATLCERARENLFFGEAIVCINAWNEWCEGAYLEPDQHYGAAYLNATGRAVTQPAFNENAKKILLVGHDAFAAGAQQLLVNIGRTLQWNFGVEIEFLLLGPGRLDADYAALAAVTIAHDEATMRAAIRSAARRGFSRAIVNSVASGRAVDALLEFGIAATSLVHELPRIIQEKNLTQAVSSVLSQSKTIVFPARFVQDRVLGTFGSTVDHRMFIIPQGIYKPVVCTPDEAAAIRAEFGLTPLDRLIIGAGYADMRKGFDLFLQAWRLLRSGGANRVHFAWIGDIDPSLKSWLDDEIKNACATMTFHMPGYRNDIGAFFGAADAFVLTSREDPFPSVVLEALSIDLPCFAFDESGGIPDLLRARGVGTIVPYADVCAMADRLRDWAAKPATKKPRAATVPETSFCDYVARLLQLCQPELPEISVAVPNFNYAAHLGGRLTSIFRQTQPVKEVVVLDDASTDSSLAVISETAEVGKRTIRLISNTKNSGSVFAQWRKAAEVTSGEFIWIAEADDQSDPCYLARVTALMSSDPHILLGFSDSCAIDGAGAPLYESYKSYYSSFVPGGLSKSQIFDGAFFARTFLSVRNAILNVSAVVWRRAALLQALNDCEKELSSFRMAGDWLLYISACNIPQARIAYMAEILNIHRRHQASVTQSLNAETHLDEIARCHKAARKKLALPADVLLAQKRYLKNLRAEMSVNSPRSQQLQRNLTNPTRRFIQNSAART